MFGSHLKFWNLNSNFVFGYEFENVNKGKNVLSEIHYSR